MVSSILVTVGLALDIVGVALLLAGPQVHPREGFPLSVGNDRRSRTPLRKAWSKLGVFGLPTVSSGFTLQILGAWSQELELLCLGIAIGVTIPLIFFVTWLLVRQLPHGE